MKVMLDTNILISALFFPTRQTKELMARLSDGCEIVLCDYVVEEFEVIANRKFREKKNDFRKVSEYLRTKMVRAPRKDELPAGLRMRDEKDIPILASAIREHVDVFITGDKDFLVLDIEKPKIMTMAEFLEVC